MIKKAAMFGLDARIALAIFGALSVIVGVSLVKTIEHTQAVRLIAEANEIAKAVEAYMLDTGTDIAYSDVDSYYNLKALFVNTANVAGWKGPYLSGNSSIIAEGVGGVKSTYALRDSNNGTQKIFISLHACPTNTNSGFSHCVALQPCSYFIRIGNLEKSLTLKIDKYIDGTKDDRSGKVIYTVNAEGFMNVWIRGPLKMNQNL